MSSKPQYVPGPALRKRYVCVRDAKEAETLWCNAYSDEESTRVKEVHLLCGSVLPVWPSLVAVLKAKAAMRREANALPVKKCFIDRQPLIGVALTAEQAQEFKRLMAETDGGGDELVRAAQQRLDRERPLVAREGAAREGAAAKAVRSYEQDDEDVFGDVGEEESGLSFAAEDDLEALLAD